MGRHSKLRNEGGVPVCLSQHLSFLSVVGSLMVVYIHATTLKYSSQDIMPWVATIQGYFSHGLCHVALPLFFSFSGYLIFLRLGQGRSYFSEAGKRVRSLLVPYFIWSALWLVAIYVGGGLTSLSFGKHAVSFDEVSGVLNSWLLDPIPGQLWFVRDLLVMVALSGLLSRAPKWGLVALAAATYSVWLLAPTPTVISSREGWGYLVSTEAASWFLIGAAVARCFGSVTLRNFVETPKALMLACCAGAYVLLMGWKYLLGAPLATAWEGVAVSFGWLACFLIYPFCQSGRLYGIVSDFAKFSFLVYLAHYPLLGFLNMILVRQMDSELGHLFIYMTVPCLLVAGIVFAARQFANYCPKLLSVLDGYRSVSRQRNV